MKTTASKQKASSAADPNVARESSPFPGSEAPINDIATAAYFKAEARGFAPGQELDDWLEAEARFRAKQEH